LSFICRGQKETNPHKDLPIVFFQRLRADYGTANGKKMERLPPSPNMDFEFKRDHTYKLYGLNNQRQQGTWEYNVKEKCVYIKRGDGKVNGRFINIKRTA